MGQTPIEGRPSRIGTAPFVLRQKISLLPAVIFSGYQNPSPFPRHNGQSGRRVRPGGSRPQTRIIRNRWQTAVTTSVSCLDQGVLEKCLASLWYFRHPVFRLGFAL